MRFIHPHRRVLEAAELRVVGPVAEPDRESGMDRSPRADRPREAAEAPAAAAAKRLGGVPLPLQPQVAPSWCVDHEGGRKREHAALKLPLLGSNQESPDPEGPS
jgi:hypothetical protein